ncbi:MAG: cytidine deaminase [Brumimicrobium sp.]
MKKEFSFKYEHFISVTDLDDAQQNLMKEANKAMNNAYAPYSKFKVGAALLLDDGSYIHGSNQENIAYPSGLCAERVALFSLGAQFPDKKVKKIAIVGQGSLISSDDLLTPCGSCRQVMSEVASNQGKDFEILMKNHDGSVLVFDGIDKLLPFTFGS